MQIADPSHSASIDTEGLHIQTGIGVQCEPWITLRDPRKQLDIGSLGQITDYLTTNVVDIPDSKGNPIAVIRDYQFAIADDSPRDFRTVVSMPPSLQQLYGSTGNDFRTRYGLDNPNFSPSFGCQEQLEFTNLTNRNIQLDQIGVTFLSSSKPNDTAYHLIDLCSVNGCPCPACGGSSAYGCPYYAQIALHSGVAGTTINAPLRSLRSSTDCVQAIVPPHQVFSALVVFSSQEASQIYSLGMTFSIKNAQGERTIHLPEAFNSTQVFASSDQFSCYKLVNNRFVVEDPPDLANCI